jgi:DNA-binding transcriptional MerR regulator
VSPANIRYYEKEGLLPPGAGVTTVTDFTARPMCTGCDFMRLCRAMDMSLDEVRTLLALDLTRKEDCHAACDTLDEHLRHVRARLAELQALEADLMALRSRCDGSDAQCHIIEALHQRADAQSRTHCAGPAAGKRHV